MKEILYITSVGLFAFSVLFLENDEYNDFIRFIACAFIFIAGLSIGFKWFPQLFSL